MSASPSHSTSMTRSLWPVDSDTAFAQSARCTDTPRPRVTKPTISSPGTGVQHRDRRTITSSRPSTWMPRVVGALALPRRADGDGQLLLGLLLALAQDAADPLGDRRARDMVVADRDVEALEVVVAHRDCRVLEDVGAQELLDGQALAAHRLDELFSAGLDRVFAPLTREPLTDLVARPGRHDDLEPVT